MLMVVAGPLVWLQVERADITSPPGVIFWARGWPLVYQTTFEIDFESQGITWSNSRQTANVPEKGLIRFLIDGKSFVRPWQPWSLGKFLGNIATALAILAAVAVGCEGLIRKRERAVKQAIP